MNNVLKVRILSPRGDLFSGDAMALSSYNSVGKFDILPGHGNFITITRNSPIFILLPQKRLKFDLPISIIYAVNNQVKIYTDFHLQLT